MQKHRAGLAVHFPLSARICWTRLSISSGVSLPAYLGIRPLPLAMMLRKSSTDAATLLSETSDGPPKCLPSAVFPWHFAHSFLYTGFSVSLVPEDGVCPDAAPTTKYTAHIAIVSGYVFTSHLIVNDPANNCRW